MKITSFNPLILTKEADAAIDLMKSLGFEIRHNVGNITDKDIVNVDMKDANGFRVDVAKVDVPTDRIIIRMNVDNFEEAYDFLISKGFTNPSGRVVESKSSKSVMMVSPSGYAFDLCHHIKNHD